MANATGFPHPVLTTPELTTCESIRGALERFTHGAEIISPTMITMISAVAALALVGLTMTLTGNPALAEFLFVVSAALGVGTILGIFIGIFRVRSEEQTRAQEEDLTELHQAVITKSYCWMKSALQNSEIDPNAVVRKGFTALHLAVIGDDLIAAELLLKNPSVKANIEKRTENPKNKTPTTSKDRVDLLRDVADSVENLSLSAHRFTLSLSGGDMTKANPTASQLAVASGSKAMLRLLLKFGASLATQNAAGDNMAALTNRLHENDTAKRDGILAVIQEFAPRTMSST